MSNDFTPSQVKLAGDLLTDAVHLLWQKLTDRQRFSHAFYQQALVVGHRVDFLCRELKLVIELDGGHAALNRRYDSKRTAEMESHGYTVMRFWRHQVTGNIQQVLLDIERQLEWLVHQRQTD